MKGGMVVVFIPVGIEINLEFEVEQCSITCSLVQRYKGELERLLEETALTFCCRECP
jgi:hypothetical protein